MSNSLGAESKLRKTMKGFLKTEWSLIKGCCLAWDAAITLFNHKQSTQPMGIAKPIPF